LLYILSIKIIRLTPFLFSNIKPGPPITRPLPLQNPPKAKTSSDTGPNLSNWLKCHNSWTKASLRRKHP